MKTLITLTLFLIFFPSLSNGQLKKEADYVDEYSKDYKVFTNSDNILTVAQYFSAEEKSYYFKLTFLDKELTPIFDRKVFTVSKQSTPRYFKKNNVVTIYNQDKLDGTVFVASLDLDTREVFSAKTKFKVGSYKTIVKLDKDYVVIKVIESKEVGKSKKAFYKINLSKLSAQNKLYFSDKEEIEFYSFSQEDYIGIEHFEKAPSKIKRVSNNEEQLFDVIKNVENPEHIRVTGLKDGAYLVYGNYNARNTEGLFVLKAIKDSIIFYKEIDYLEMESFYDNKGEKVKLQHQKRADKNLGKGKNRGINYSFYPFLVEKENGYTLRLQFYYKEYSGEEDNYFEGFKFVNCISVNLDAGGNKIWDNNINYEYINPEKEWHKLQVISIENENNSYLVYASNRKLFVYSVNGSGKLFEYAVVKDYDFEGRFSPELELIKLDGNQFLLKASKRFLKNNDKVNSIQLVKYSIE